ncbi:hypothetical protein SLG_00300 [Sphingobium sp. SYK-6]|nr:hypothetical protein SLG_00300 [Sphingobium sp. SYK-6]
MLRTLLLCGLLATVGSATLEPACAQERCCKICRAGKACGDSCIAKDRVCKKVGGCACDG